MPQCLSEGRGVKRDRLPKIEPEEESRQRYKRILLSMFKNLDEHVLNGNFNTKEEGIESLVDCERLANCLFHAVEEKITGLEDQLKEARQKEQTIQQDLKNARSAVINYIQTDFICDKSVDENLTIPELMQMMHASENAEACSDEEP